MTDHRGLTYQVSPEGRKNHRVVTMTRDYWEECGSPDPSLELFKKAVYIGYGSSAIRVLLAGLDPKVNDVHLTAEFMGYNEGLFEIIIKE